MKFFFLLLIFYTGIFSEDKVEKIYALEYGKSVYPTELLNSKSNVKSQNILWLFYYIETTKKKILIDTGFTENKYIKTFGIENYQNPKSILESIGVSTEEITDIIITHSHFDHMGGIHLFPNAKIFIQSKELDYLYSREMNQSYEKVLNIRSLRNSIEKLGPNFYFSDYLTIYFSGGHTIGSQVVHLKFDNKEYFITGDECYFANECISGIGLNPKAAYNLENNKNFISKLNNFYSKNPKLEVLTLHDSYLLIQYKKIQKNVIQIYLRESKK